MVIAEAVEGQDLSTGGARPASWGLITAASILAVLVVVAVAAPLISPDSPVAVSPNAMAGPSGAHLLGTDPDGRDVLSRLIWGARPALEGVGVGLGVMLVLGVPWGLAAGYLGRWTDEVLMRIADAFLAFPGIILAIAITAVLGPSLLNAMTSVGVVLAPSIARLMRGAVLPLRTADFVRIPTTFGVGRATTIWRHVFPNAMAPVLVQTCAIAGVMLIIESALFFLGIGSSVSTPSWGGDLAAAYQYFVSNPWATVAPGLVIALASICLVRVGDGLKGRLDLR